LHLKKRNPGTERDQIQGYTEDGDITGTSVMVVKETFIKPEEKKKKAHEMDLIILIMNQIKTKHMEIMTKSANTPFLSVITYL
jgi:hypothetical protein